MMKFASLVVLSFFVAVVGFAPVADAAPSENGVINSDGKAGGWKANIQGFLSGNSANNGKPAFAGSQGSVNIQGTTLTQNTSTQSVPVPGTLLLFGAGFVVFAVWHQLSRRGKSALTSAV